MEYPPLADQLDIEPVPGLIDTFISKTLPKRLGNALPIAYGGCTAGVAVHSACRTVADPNFYVYSVLGAFHGPAKTDRQIICRVTRTRDTKTFSTRRVVAYQKQDDGSERNCLDVFVDFHVLEPELFHYSATPFRQYSNGPTDPDATADYPGLVKRLVDSGHLSQDLADANSKMFAAAAAFYETRHCLEGVSGQNLMGYAKHVKTTQSHLPMPDRTSAEWLRAHQKQSNQAENIAALAFIMDGGLSFLPLNHGNLNFDDAGACSTLDFALRIMVPTVDMREWHLRERRSLGAAVGRSYSESKLWGEDGTLVAVATQACIARPPPKNRAKI